jgi:hypothetical protein
MHYKPKVFARQRDNYGYGNALGYAQEVKPMLGHSQPQ